MQEQERRSSRRQLRPRDKIGVDVGDLAIGQVVQSILATRVISSSSVPPTPARAERRDDDPDQSPGAIPGKIVSRRGFRLSHRSSRKLIEATSVVSRHSALLRH
jgi:hypothetical protein